MKTISEWPDLDELKITAIINDPAITWKVKRALLRDELRLPEYVIKLLVPEGVDLERFSF